MYFKKKIGEYGEQVAKKYIQQNNYEIIESNFRVKQGEIDIIAQDKKSSEIVFIEVKTRTNLKYGNPIEAINKNKKEHIYKTAMSYIYIHKLENKSIRFDVMEIYINNSKININHVKNVILNQ